MKEEAKRACLFASNAILMLSWLRILWFYVSVGWNDIANDMCLEVLHPMVVTTLAVCTLLELVTSLLGLTRSNPLQVLLFAATRMGVETLVSPLDDCTAWQHLGVVLCWTSGEVVRFGCFALYELFPEKLGYTVKSIRYTVGPIMFPIGAFGEMLMVIRAAQDDRPLLYVAASLWPVGFYPLIRQLLKQRRRHFQGAKETTKKKK